MQWRSTPSIIAATSDDDPGLTERLLWPRRETRELGWPPKVGRGSQWNAIVERRLALVQSADIDHESAIGCSLDSAFDPGWHVMLGDEDQAHFRRPSSDIFFSIHAEECPNSDCLNLGAQSIQWHFR